MEGAKGSEYGPWRGSRTQVKPFDGVAPRWTSVQKCVGYVPELGNWIFLSAKDKELDIVEMAVYGDVIRPGNQCRCRTVAEMLGQYKSKSGIAACELPYKEES